MSIRLTDIIEDALFLVLLSLAITIATTFVPRYRRLGDIRAAYEIGRQIGRPRRKAKAV